MSHSLKFLFFFVFLAACGQQAEIVGPHQRVEFDDDLATELTGINHSISGVCDPGSPLVIESLGLVPTRTNLTCSPTGDFSLAVVLTNTDGDKVITVTQTDDPTGAITSDRTTVNLDQNPPVLVADVEPVSSYGVSTVVSNVLANDSDLGRGIDPTTLSVLSISNTSAGSCSVNFGFSAVILFTPELGFSGPVQCTYQVADLLGNFSSTTVDFEIGPSSPLVANDNAVGGSQNLSVFTDVLSNDLDPDGQADIDPSTLTITSPTNVVTEGSCSVGPTPSSLTFNPVLNFFGTAVCTYQVCDFAGNCDTADFSVTMADQTTPVAVKDTASLNSGGSPITLDVSANDTDAAGNLDPSSVQVLSSNGGVCTLSPTAPNIQFSPATGFVGLANCSYRICDTTLNCSTGVFEVSVLDGQAPLASNDSTSTTANIPTNPINVSINDLDQENQLDLSSVTIVGGEVNGTCVVGTSPQVTFTPAVNTIGIGGCDYQICDSASNCSTARLVVTVTDVNSPVANSDAHTTNQNTASAPFDVTANDTDSENLLDLTSVTLTGVSSGGSCTVASPNVTFTPDLDFSGNGSCGYSVCDTSGNCSQSQLLVNVNDITAPTVTIDQLNPGQADPASATPILFSLVFSEEINPASLSSSDVDTTGSTASGGVFSFLNSGDNQNFTLQVNALTTDGAIQVSLPVGSFEDVNGVSNTLASTNLDNIVTYDATAPGKPIVLSPAFSTLSSPDVDVSCDPGSDVQIQGQGLSPNPYPSTALVCPSGGAVTFSAVPFSGASPYTIVPISSDSAGNLVVGDAFVVTIDSLSPDLDLTVLTGQSTNTNSLPIFFSAVFSEPIDPASFTTSDITNTGTATGGVWTILNSGDDQTFTLSINALTSDGTVTPSVGALAVDDLAGNSSTASTSSGVNTVSYDGTVPSAPIITDPFFTQDDTPDLIVNCESNEDLEFVITPYAGTNPVTSSCVGGSAVVNVPSSLGSDGTYTILPSAIDGVGNSTDGNVFTLVLDRVSPTPTITLNSGQSTLTNNTPIFFDVSWDEPIDPSTFTGVDLSNIGTASGGVWTVSNSGDNQNFIVSLTSLTGVGTVIPQISAGLASDEALNLSNLGSYSGAPVTFDNQSPGQPIVLSPSNTSSSTPVVNVSCDTDVQLVTLTIPGYASSPVTAGPCTTGSLNISLPTPLPVEGLYTVTPTAEDAAGNSIIGSSFDVSFDQTAPSIILDRLVSQPTQTNQLPISFSVTFSEAIDPSTFTAADVIDISGASAPGGSWAITNSGDNISFTLSRSGLTGDGFVRPQILASSVSDLTGLTNSAVNAVGSNGDTVEYVVSPPATPSVISPAFTNTLTPSIDVNCELGSLVQLSISGYTPDPYPSTAISCTNSPLSIALTPAVPSEGTFTVRAVSSDSIGNSSLPITYDVSFDEPIDASTFIVSDIQNSGSTGSSGSWIIANSGDDQNFVISLSALTSDGNVIPSLLAGAISDKAGNMSTASTAVGDVDVAYDGTPPGIPAYLAPRYSNDSTPTLSINCDIGSEVQIQSPSINSGNPFPVTPVNCASTPVSITLLTALSDGDYLITPRAQDAVGNVSFGSVQTLTIDTISPEVTIDRLATVTPDRTNSEPVVFSVVFSEAIDNASFTSASITNASGSLAPGLWTVTNSGDNQNYTITATAIVGAGDIEPQILSAAVQDLAGNFNNTYTVLSDGDVYFDNVAPDTSDILTWAWTLSSPNDGEFSPDNTPQLSLSGASSEENGVIQFYNAVNCIGAQGSASNISSGTAAVSDIAYVTDGSDDGLKEFFVQVIDDVGNVSACVPLGLSYTFDTIAPFATVSQALTQQDPADDLNLFFEVFFDEAIDPSTFTVADLVHVGTIPNLTMTITNSGDDQNFSVEISSPDTGGTAELELLTGSIADKAGNLNLASVYPDNVINYPCDNPEAIDDLYYGPVTKETVDLFWTKKADDDCQPVSDYEIEYREVGDPTWTLFNDGISADPLATVTGLNSNTDYEFRIRSFNDLFSDHSNITQTITKPDTPFFDPTEYKLINLSGAVDSTVVALEDGTEVYVTNDVTDPAPTLLAMLDAGETHQFSSPAAPSSTIARDDILISNKPIFATGRVGAYTFSCSGSGNPTWVPPLWSEKSLLFNASRNSPQTIYVFAFEDANVTVFRNNAVVVPSTFIAANTIAVLNASGTGAFRIDSDAFIVASRHGTSFVDDMPALPKASQIMGYPSNAGLLSTVSVGTSATLFHSDGFSLVETVNPSAFTSMSPRGSLTSLYRSEALFIEADDLISANNTADSDGCNSAPFNPIHLMMRRYAVNVDSQYVAFASTVGAKVRMIKPDGTESEFDLVRTGSGPFALRSPYKFYLTNIEGGTRFEGVGPQDRFSVWYQSDTRDGAGYEDETIIYGYK